MQIPDEAVRYILYQRTSYLRLTRTKPFRLAAKLAPGLVYSAACRLESKISKTRIVNEYRSDITNEYEEICPFLPPEIDAVLDIGCGIAGIDALLDEHY